MKRGGRFRYLLFDIHNPVLQRYGQQVVVQLNAAARERKYQPGLSEKLTGKMVEELDRDWRAELEKAVNRERSP